MSPCISVCILDDDDVCIGCYRTSDEIETWSDLTPEHQEELTEECAKRGI